jgi:hypothetical protein
MADRKQSASSNRGFASMDEKKQRDIASKGGQASGGNFKNDRERAAAAGRKGGQSVPAAERSFSRNHQLAAEAGRKGGEHSRGGHYAGPIGASHGPSPDRRNPERGRGELAEDREPLSETGRAGGDHHLGGHYAGPIGASHGRHHDPSHDPSHDRGSRQPVPGNSAEDREPAAETGRAAGEQGGRDRS